MQEIKKPIYGVVECLSNKILEVLKQTDDLEEAKTFVKHHQIFTKNTLLILTEVLQ